MHDNKNSEAQQWELIEEHYRNGKPLGGLVTKATRERLFIDVGGIQGTVEYPTHAYTFSVDTEHDISSEERLERALEQMTGQMLPLKVIEVDCERHHLLLSQQLYTKEERQDRLSRQAQLLEEIQPGDIRKGIVLLISQSIVSLVDVEGVDGWIPGFYLSLHNPRIEDAHEVVHIGQVIEVMVVENNKKKLLLSLIHAQQRDTVLETMQPGQILTAHISFLSTEGAYVDLGGPIGLVPAHQIVHSYITHPADVFHKGQEVVVRVEQIEENKRVMLSLIEAR